MPKGHSDRNAKVSRCPNNPNAQKSKIQEQCVQWRSTYPSHVPQIEKQGGIKSIGDKNILKANYLYNEIDRNSLFTGFAEKNDRSEMNATFNLVEESLTETFDNLCLSVGISGLKGHRSVGGYRASIYNALPIESVEILVDCMKSLEQNN